MASPGALGAPFGRRSGERERKASLGVSVARLFGRHMKPIAAPTHATVTSGSLSGEHDIFFAAVEMTRMPMIVTDPSKPDNPIVFANAAFQIMSGYALDELVGRNCRFLQGPETDRAVVQMVRDAVAAKTDIAVEILNYRKDGSAFWNALFISPVFDADGRLIYFFGSQLDVTRRHDAEEGLRQAQRMEAVGQLTGGLAHDFNNLLTVIMANVEGALAAAASGRQRRQLENALLASQKAATLTAQLLAFARKQSLDGRPSNLNHLIGNLREMTERTLGKEIAIALELQPDLPLAKVDAVQAEVALLNILINARDAMPENGRVTIRTRAVALAGEAASQIGLLEGDYVALDVCDTGPGIAPSILARVTEPFFTTKEVGKGTGMGLAQVYGFMRQSRGQLKIASEPGQGTTVSLYFPATAEPPDIRHSRPEPEVRGGDEIVLFVEDNPEVMSAGESILREFGYRIVPANNGRSALEILESGQPVDILFSDIVMPGGVNGVNLARRARKLRPNLKVLLTTGWADRALDNEEDRAGFDLIGKPYRREDLARRIRAVLDGATGV